ncbi:hypothetical protein KIN_10160 [Litoreibacter roseus]|uniref:Uncharacterized protein n=1 Tax=Litoreibacter roseus TaxID=2601869 RepID=A0A6N6JFF8_9RHOB|nr:hypothetical protein KIN_10160 [Litoreibacter roseus]
MIVSPSVAKSLSVMFALALIKPISFVVRQPASLSNGDPMRTGPEWFAIVHKRWFFIANR